MRMLEALARLAELGSDHDPIIWHGAETTPTDLAYRDLDADASAVRFAYWDEGETLENADDDWLLTLIAEGHDSYGLLGKHFGCVGSRDLDRRLQRLRKARRIFHRGARWVVAEKKDEA